MKKIIVIGGGPAGMMAGIFASKNNNEVILLEQNEKLGKKLYITGKGRCNLSNDSTEREFLESVNSNSKFLTSAVYSLSPKQTMEFFEENGLALKVERGNRVFPASDKASDVTKTLEKVCKQNGVKIMLNTKVLQILTENSCVKGVLTESGEIYCDSIIVATGGISYSSTGSRGDGYIFAKNLGHTIKDVKPALVGLELKGDFYRELQGISLKNVNLTALTNGKTIYSELGEMIFTHYGISGPIVLSCSCLINRLNLNEVELILDLKPALDEKTLDLRLIRELENFKLKSIINVMPTLLPKNMANTILKIAGIKPNKICAEITKEERNRLNFTLKNLKMQIKSLRPIDEAIVTAGGVNVKEINPKTMESKLIKGLFFAGEVLDVDAFTGGFNVQIAFSTGKVAGENA